MKENEELRKAKSSMVNGRGPKSSFQAPMEAENDQIDDPAQALLMSGHLPKSSEEYLKQMTIKIDTNDLLEIVQVFHHKQSRNGVRMPSQDQACQNGLNGTNDYVVVVLKINSQELRQFYGDGKYLVQIWKNQKRLFQHVHDYQIKEICLNRTQMAYMLDIPSGYVDPDQVYDFDLNFIYVIQPFTQNFARIKYPFEQEDFMFTQGETVLYVSDEYLIVGRNNSIKYAKIDDFLVQKDRKNMARQTIKEKKIKYFQEYSVQMDVNVEFSINSTSAPQKRVTRFAAEREIINPENICNDPELIQKQKEMFGNKSLYADSKAYIDKYEVETLEFKNCLMGIEFDVLAISTAIVKGTNTIVVHAAKKNELILQLFRLCVENFSGNSSTDFEELTQEKGLKTSGDQYTSIKVVNTSENQTMTILKTKDNKVDITGDLLKEGEVYDRFSDKVQGKISDIIFGSDKIHVLVNDDTIQFSLNAQTSKVDYNSRISFQNLTTSLLDEEFFKVHLRVFDDIKVLQGLMILAHGQVISIYRLSQKTWSHYFNRKEIERSNQQTKQICSTKNMDDFMEEQKKYSISDHCHFNRKACEVLQMAFLPIVSESFYELMICQQNGQVRKVSVIYTKQKPQGFESYEIEVQQGPPLIIAKAVLSKCGSLNKDKQYQAASLVSQTNYTMFKELGVFETRMFISLQDGDKLDEEIRDVYTNNEENQISMLMSIDRDSFKNCTIIPVYNAKSNHLFMFDLQNKSLNVYNIEQYDCEYFTMNCLNSQRLMISIPNFNFCPSLKYFLDKDQLFFVSKGDLHQVSLTTGERQKHDFGRSIMDGQYFMLPGQQIYFKTKKNQLHFVDLNWGCSKIFQQVELLKNQSTFQNQIEYDAINNLLVTFTSPNVISAFPNLSQFETECQDSLQFNEKFIASNIDRSFMKHLQKSESDNYAFEQPLEEMRLGKYLCPSEFVANLCALDAEKNTVKVWNIGTGQVVKEFQELKDNFVGFRRHNVWNNSTLILKDRATQNKMQLEAIVEEDGEGFELKRSNSSVSDRGTQRFTISAKKSLAQVQNFDQRDIWRKIRVDENGVTIQKQFYHNYKPDSTLFLSSTNDIVLEFTCESIEIFNIRENGFTERVDEIKRMENLQIPAYFTDDFKRYMDFHQDKNSKSKRIRVFESKPRIDIISKVKQQEKYREIQDIFTPELDSIQMNEHCQPYIHFTKNDYICYLNINNVEQTIKICHKDELKENKHLITEKFLSSEKVQIRKDMDPLNFQVKKIQNMCQKGRFEVKNRLNSDFNSELKRIQIIRDQNEISTKNAIREADKTLNIQVNGNEDISLYSINNLRFLQAYSFNTWRIIEMLKTNKICINQICPKLLPQLMQVILPNGQTLTNVLINNCNLNQLEKLVCAIRESRKGERPLIPFENIPDILGVTPLHECVQNTYTKAAEDILDLMGKNALDNHSSQTQDILSDLIETCPMAMSNYFEDRMIQCPWAMKHTIGNLKTADEEVGFGVFSNPLILVDQKEVEDTIFEKETLIQETLRKNQEQKRLPMSIQVFDFPKIHHFDNPIGRDLILAISESDEISIFDMKYVQAILEYQWPAVRKVIIRDLFVPYILFLIAFNYYAIYQFEREQDNFMHMPTKIEGYLVKTLIVILSFYFLGNEYLQLKHETSTIKYLTSFWNYIDLIPLVLVLSALTLSAWVQFAESDIAHWQRYLNAVASFFIWFKFLYFFRIFRTFGHLIKTIIEVINDMKVFMVILSMSILAFSGTFFILAQNNQGDQVFVDSYIGSILQMFELMLGNFDSDKFGETGYFVVYLMFALASLFLIVIMLNLLIAIISDTFAEVQNQAQRKMYQEFAQLICENYHLLSEAEKKRYDSQGNYLFISQIQQGSEQGLGTNVNGSFSMKKDQQSVTLDKTQMLLINQMIKNQVQELESNFEKIVTQATRFDSKTFISDRFSF